MASSPYLASSTSFSSQSRDRPLCPCARLRMASTPLFTSFRAVPQLPAAGTIPRPMSTPSIQTRNGEWHRVSARLTKYLHIRPSRHRFTNLPWYTRICLSPVQRMKKIHHEVLDMIIVEMRTVLNGYCGVFDEALTSLV